MALLGVTMPVLQAPNKRVRDFTKAAEDAGLHSAWDYEFYRNPFVMHAAAAHRTSTLKLGVGLANAGSRSPFEMANAAADVDDFSDGRLILAIGTGGPDFMSAYHDTPLDRPVPRLREYIQVMQMVWQHLATDEPVSHRGTYHQLQSMGYNPFGGRKLTRPRIPVYLGAMGPLMLQLAGEVCDGALGYLQTPRYVRDHALPNIARGARRAGRDPKSIEFAGINICSVSKDRAEAWRRGRIQVGMYIAYPASDRVVAFHGLEKEQHQLRMALAEKGVEALQDVTDDNLVETFSITGTPDEAREKAKKFEEVIPHLIFHTPYMPPLSVEETEDAYFGILEAFGDRAFSRPR